jgi:HK97 family phage major capsid protein
MNVEAVNSLISDANKAAAQYPRKALKAYRQLKVELVAAGHANLEAAKFAGRNLSAAEKHLADKIHAQIEETNERVALLEAAQERERRMPSIGSNELDSTSPRPAVGGKFAQLFPGRAYSSGGELESTEAFLKAVHAASTTGMFHPGLKATMTEGIPGSGGFAVPEPLAAAWLDRGLEDELVRSRATVYPMSADSLKVPGWDDMDHSSGSIAGFSATWQGELTSAPSADGKVRRVKLDAKKLMIATTLSNELLMDGGQTFQGQLEQKMGAAIGWSLDNTFINGIGGGQPLGILKDPALVVVAKEGSQAASTVLYENVVKMYAALFPGGYKNAVWAINHSVLPQLLMLTVRIKNAAGTDFVGGSQVPVLISGPDGVLRLLGIPVICSEKLPALTNQGDIILCDLSQYAIGLRAELMIESSRHVGWTTDTTAYRAVIRVDGMGTWSKAFTPKAGGTRSWIVALQAR